MTNTKLCSHEEENEKNNLDESNRTPQTHRKQCLGQTPEVVGGASSKTIQIRRRLSFMFFLLVFVLSVPFWLISSITGFQLLRGLPISSFMALCTITAALILKYKENGTEGVKMLLKRCFDFKQIRAKIWYVPIILLMPGTATVTYALMLLIRSPLPSFTFPVLGASIMFFVFFAEAVCEEIGWMGYAADKLQGRWNALQAGVLLGLVTAAWHVIPFLQMNRSLEWIAWQSLLIVASRILIVWIYNNTGRSVFATILFHDMINMSSLLFPNFGSHYNPQITSLITVCVAVVVIVVWGPRFLNRRGTPSLLGTLGKNG